MDVLFGSYSVPFPIEFCCKPGTLSNDDGDAARGRRLVKNEFIFYQRNSQLSRSVQNAIASKHVLRLNMQ